MLKKIWYWISLASLTFAAGYSINKGFFLIFSSILYLIGSIFGVFIVNVVFMSLMDKAKETEADRRALPWIISHNNFYKYPVLILIVISQLSMFSYWMSEGTRYKSGLLFVVIILSAVFAGLISLGKRK